LGLAIVREVIRTHGGEVAFLPGMPCSVEVRVPAAKAQGKVGGDVPSLPNSPSFI
jgi:hypothetical protein